MVILPLSPPNCVPPVALAVFVIIICDDDTVSNNGARVARSSSTSSSKLFFTAAAMYIYNPFHPSTCLLLQHFISSTTSLPGHRR